MTKTDINMRFVKAIESLLQDKGLTKTGIAQSLGIKPSKFSEILNFRMNVGTETIALLCDLYSFNPTWILLGEGSMLTVGTLKGHSKPAIAIPKLPDIPLDSNGVCEMFLTIMQDKDLRAKEQIEEITLLKEQLRNSKIKENGDTARLSAIKSLKGIPLIPLDAVAGFPASDSDGVYLEDCEHYSIPEFEAKGANFLIRVSGDSMMPLYNNGDIIACRKISDILFFQWGSIYVLDTSQGALVKRIEECEKNDDCILCVSENPHFKPFQLPKTDIRSLSTIIGLVRLL